MDYIEGMVVNSIVVASHSKERQEIVATIVLVFGKSIWLLDEQGCIYIVKDYELYVKE